MAKPQFKSEGAYRQYRAPIFSMVIATSGESRMGIDARVRERVTNAMLEW